MPLSSLAKICYVCGRVLPVEHFRYRKHGSPARQGKCRACHNGYMRTYRTARRHRKLTQFATQVRQETSASKVAALCGAMIARFGGLDRFCTAWKAQIDATTPGSRASFSSFLAILRLAELVESQRCRPDYAHLSDNDLDRELRQLLGTE